MCNNYNYDDCYICKWNDFTHDTLMTLQDLIEASKDSIYTMKDYIDRRKSTNITRFNYCPFCGEKINWKTIYMISKEK